MARCKRDTGSAKRNGYDPGPSAHAEARVLPSVVARCLWSWTRGQCQLVRRALFHGAEHASASSSAASLSAPGGFAGAIWRWVRRQRQSVVVERTRHGGGHRHAPIAKLRSAFAARAPGKFRSDRFAIRAAREGDLTDEKEDEDAERDSRQDRERPAGGTAPGDGAGERGRPAGRTRGIRGRTQCDRDRHAPVRSTLTDAQREKRKAYRQRPEVRERMKAYRVLRNERLRDALAQPQSETTA